MSSTERDYYSRRALEERVCAAQSSSVAAEIHLELACLYEKLAGLEEGEKPPAIFEDRLSA